ncbi:hypothetical protein ACFV16_35300, partial [Streptomyces massasporeus]|uniref:hypothetical protein n=1 Tax=Streptomyces massasporeus TaxID=67324 RepID=UPI003676A4BB
MDGLPASVDHDILAHRSIAAIAMIRETLGCTVHQAVDAYAQRYEELRRGGWGRRTAPPPPPTHRQKATRDRPQTQAGEPPA